MYNVLKSLIRGGDFKLDDIRHRIKQMHLLGDLTEEQMFDLLEKANQKANAEGERPEVMQMLRTISERVEALEKEISILKNLESGENSEEHEEIEAWTPWDGISNKYQPESIVAHIGKVWISVFEGQNVWEPGTVDDRFWKEYEEYVPEPEETPDEIPAEELL